MIPSHLFRESTLLLEKHPRFPINLIPKLSLEDGSVFYGFKNRKMFQLLKRSGQFHFRESTRGYMLRYIRCAFVVYIFKSEALDSNNKRICCVERDGLLKEVLEKDTPIVFHLFNLV